MKVLYNNKERCLDILCSVSVLLEECWKSPSLIPMLEKIRVSMFNLKAVLDANPQIEYEYKDVLDAEISHFKNREIPYLDGISGLTGTISFKNAQFDEKIAVLVDKSKKTKKLPPHEHYVVGNEAIGQIYIDGEEAFCIKHAIEHSLRSTVERWHKASESIKVYFEEL